MAVLCGEISAGAGRSGPSAAGRDAERAAELVNDEARAHLGAPIWSTEQVLRHWSNPIVDRERDVAVVEAPGGEVCAWLSLVCGPPHVEVFALGVVYQRVGMTAHPPFVTWERELRPASDAAARQRAVRKVHRTSLDS